MRAHVLLLVQLVLSFNCHVFNPKGRRYSVLCVHWEQWGPSAPSLATPLAVLPPLSSSGEFLAETGRGWTFLLVGSGCLIAPMPVFIHCVCRVYRVYRVYRVSCVCVCVCE